MPVHCTDGVDIFLRDLFVGNSYGLVFAVVGQIAQMYEQSQHIVLGSKCRHVIDECACIDAHGSACQHLYDCILQTIHVHLNIDL